MMDFAISNTVVGALMLAVGWIIQQLWSMAKEARRRRKTEMQKIIEERDYYKEQAEKHYNRKQRYKDIIWETRRAAVDDWHVPQEALPEVPPDDT
jgi:uncharacterized membrane-anchored protein YhcB (DUF1043 family)